MTTEKATLAELIAKYNRLSAVDSLQSQEIENGNFPWKAELRTGEGMSIT